MFIVPFPAFIITQKNLLSRTNTAPNISMANAVSSVSRPARSVGGVKTSSGVKSYSGAGIAGTYQGSGYVAKAGAPPTPHKPVHIERKARDMVEHARRTLQRVQHAETMKDKAKPPPPPAKPKSVIENARKRIEENERRKAEFEAKKSGGHSRVRNSFDKTNDPHARNRSASHAQDKLWNQPMNAAAGRNEIREYHAGAPTANVQITHSVAKSVALQEQGELKAEKARAIVMDQKVKEAQIERDAENARLNVATMEKEARLAKADAEIQALKVRAAEEQKRAAQLEKDANDAKMERLRAEKMLESAQGQVERARNEEAVQLSVLENQLTERQSRISHLEMELQKAQDMISSLQHGRTKSATIPEGSIEPSLVKQFVDKKETTKEESNVAKTEVVIKGGGGGNPFGGGGNPFGADALAGVKLKKAPPPEKKPTPAPVAKAPVPAPEPLPTPEPEPSTRSSDETASSTFLSPSEGTMTLEEIQAMTPADIEALLESHTQLERQNRILMRQLEQAGITVAEDIPYDFAKEKVATVSMAMMTLLESGEDLESAKNAALMFQYEQDLDRFSQALLNSDEYGEEQKAKQDGWLNDNISKNQEALKQIRRCMPVNIKHMSVELCTKTVTPNGKQMSKSLINRFKKCNIMDLLRMDPVKIIKGHPSDLENLKSFGYKLYERRAVFEMLRPIATENWAGKKDDSSQRRYQFFQSQMDGLKAAEAKGDNGKIPAEYQEDLGYPEYEEFISSGPILSAADNKAYSPSQMLGKKSAAKSSGFDHFKTAERNLDDSSGSGRSSMTLGSGGPRSSMTLGGSGSSLLSNNHSKSMFNFSNPKIDESSTGDQKSRVAALEAKMKGAKAPTPGGQVRTMTKARRLSEESKSAAKTNGGSRSDILKGIKRDASQNSLGLGIVVPAPAPASNDALKNSLAALSKYKR